MNSTIALIILPFVIAIPSVTLGLLINETIKLRKERLRRTQSD